MPLVYEYPTRPLPLMKLYRFNAVEKPSIACGAAACSITGTAQYDLICSLGRLSCDHTYMRMLSYTVNLVFNNSVSLCCRVEHLSDIYF